MTQRKRTLALLLAVAVFFVLLSSFTFIVFHANHDCVGENCAICETLCVCAECFHRLSVAVLLSAIAVAVTALFRDCGAAAAFSRTTRTLVALNVKLSN